MRARSIAGRVAAPDDRAASSCGSSSAIADPMRAQPHRMWDRLWDNGALPI
jgi:hypothetical protein